MLTGVERINIEPTYKKSNGLWTLDIDAVKLPFEVKKRSIVFIPPQQFGGNYKHPRTEAFIGIGSGLYLVWIDGDGDKHKEQMNPDGKLFLFLVRPGTPHAVINDSQDTPGSLIEFADSEQEGVESCAIIHSKY